MPKLYVIPNAHLDPVWLWPWRDGYSEAHNTVQSAVDRLNENPDMTFSFSSSILFEWIEESNPQLFTEVSRLVQEKRFEPVGGWLVESDTIISSGESLMRQADYGKEYFKSRFDLDVKIAYSVDSFGQNIGLPQILSKSGFKYYVMHRPNIYEKDLPNLFWWEGSDGSRVLTIRTVPQGYFTSPNWSQQEFNDTVEEAISGAIAHQTFFMGVGDHGGGPTIKHISWLRELQNKYDIEFSTLENYFKIVEKLDNIPVIKGELTHHAIGSYGAHSGIKNWVSKCCLELHKADSLLALKPQKISAEDKIFMDHAWKNCLFNHFHDILPGTAIVPAYEQARDSLGGATDIAEKIKIRELHRLAKQIDTSDFKEGGLFIHNPLPWPRKGIVELDMLLDPNCTGKEFHSLRAPDGSNYPIQWNQAEVDFGPFFNKWGRLTALVDLPAMGYKAFSLEKDIVSEEYYEPQIPIKWLRQISFDVLYDHNDAWAHETSKRLGGVVGQAQIYKAFSLEKGPVRSKYRALYKFNNSTITLDLTHYKELGYVQADVKVDWHELYHSLKMTLDTNVNKGIIASEQAYDIIERNPDETEQPMGRWVAAVNDNETVAIITESCSAYDSIDSDKLRLTLLRCVPHAAHTDFAHGNEEFIDCGCSKHRFWFARKDNSNYRDWLPRMSKEARINPEYAMESNHKGALPKDSGDLLHIEPASMTLEGIYDNTARIHDNSGEKTELEVLTNKTGINDFLVL